MLTSGRKCWLRIETSRLVHAISVHACKTNETTFRSSDCMKTASNPSKLRQVFGRHYISIVSEKRLFRQGRRTQRKSEVHQSYLKFFDGRVVRSCQHIALLLMIMAARLPVHRLDQRKIEMDVSWQSTSMRFDLPYGLFA